MKPSWMLVLLSSVTPPRRHHVTTSQGKCGCIPLLGSIASRHGNNSSVPAHAYKNFWSSPNTLKVIDLRAPLSSASPIRGSSDAISKTTIGMWLPLSSICFLSCWWCKPHVLLSLLGQLLPLGFEMQTTLNLPKSSLSTFFSWLCGFWGEALNDITNTLLPNDHSNCNGDKSSWRCGMDYLIWSSFSHASKFSVGLEKYSGHSYFENNQGHGIWISSPKKMP